VVPVSAARSGARKTFDRARQLIFRPCAIIKPNSPEDWFGRGYEEVDSNMMTFRGGLPRLRAQEEERFAASRVAGISM
jgi:hypothetical protein